MKFLNSCFFIVFGLIILTSCDSTQKTKYKETNNQADNPSYGSAIDFENIDKSPENDVFEGTLYRNKKYLFRLEYPTAWAVNHGKAAHSVFKVQKNDLGASITVNIIPWDGPDMIKFDHSESERQETIDITTEALNSQNIYPVNLNVRKNFLFNFPAYTINYDYTLLTQEYEIPYRMKHIQCLHNGGLYNIVISMPQKSWTSEIDQQVNDCINSFRFEDEFK
ncbi:MAG: hypothetical protein ACK5DE_07375 [Bacteroidota bacterium]|jgi:hypothetical protein